MGLRAFRRIVGALHGAKNTFGQNGRWFAAHHGRLVVLARALQIDQRVKVAALGLMGVGRRFYKAHPGWGAGLFVC